MKFNFVEFDENILNMKNNYQSKSIFEEDICFSDIF